MASVPALSSGGLYLELGPGSAGHNSRAGRSRASVLFVVRPVIPSSRRSRGRWPVDRATRDGAHERARTADPFLTMEVLYQLSYMGGNQLHSFGHERPVPETHFACDPGDSPNPVSDVRWSGKRGSNSRPSAWKADALPTELFPLDLQMLPSMLANMLPNLFPPPVRRWSRENDSERAVALPLLPAFVLQLYSSVVSQVVTTRVARGSVVVDWWREKDSNLRRPEAGRFTVCSL